MWDKFIHKKVIHDCYLGEDNLSNNAYDRIERKKNQLEID